jgi:hypothetical protein
MSQEVLQGMDDHVRRILCAGAEVEHRKKLRERIDGQPEPDHLRGAAQPRSQFVQLEMWEPQVAERALVQSLCVLASTSQPSSDGGLSLAKDTLCSEIGSSPSASAVSTLAICWEGVFKRYKGV